MLFMREHHDQCTLAESELLAHGGPVFHHVITQAPRPTPVFHARNTHGKAQSWIERLGNALSGLAGIVAARRVAQVSGSEKSMTMTTALFLCRIRRIELGSGVSGRWQLILLCDRTWTVGRLGAGSPVEPKKKKKEDEKVGIATGEAMLERNAVSSAMQPLRRKFPLEVSMHQMEAGAARCFVLFRLISSHHAFEMFVGPSMGGQNCQTRTLLFNVTGRRCRTSTGQFCVLRQNQASAEHI